MATVKTKDLYEMLGVAEAATDDEIRKAYRKLAHKYHPDKTGGDKAAEEKLKEINQAYDVLKNKEKRAKYDQQRKYGAFEGGFDTGGGGFSGFDAAGFGAADFADIFGSAFGGRATSRAAKRSGTDLEASVTVTLRDVAEGASKKLTIRRHDRCTVCAGTGGKPGTSPVTCPECRGTGVVSQGNGFFTINRTCPVCQGQGQRYTDPCSACRGQGIETVSREISLRIPPGVSEGTRLRVAGEGEPGDLGTPNGDLYVRVGIAPDPIFTRDDRNLICEVPVTFVEAALGASVPVPTLTGMANLALKPGTQTGAQLRMTGMGLPKGARGSKGDQIVKILVEVPRKLTAEQKKLLREYDQDYEPEAHPLKAAFQHLIERFRK
jgi:molecular chaperone DnaJ